MLILLVGLAFLILSFSSYALAFQINGINRVLVSTPLTIFETSVLHNVDEETPNVLLAKNLVRQKLDKFYSYELSKFTDKYVYEIYFYNKEDESMCVEDSCNAVEVSFDASLIYNYQYHRVIHFEVFKTINEP